MHYDGFRTGWPELTERLFFTQVEGFWFVDYFGEEEAYLTELFQLLATPELAETLRWLSLRGLDEGANGTREWDFTPLLETRAQFPCLQSLQIARTPPENHNHSIVGRGYEESGQHATFCERVAHPLQLLYMDCGYDHQGFIENLARSDCFPQLKHFEFSDSAQFYLEDWQESCVPFAHYEQLLRSESLPSLVRFFLRHSHLSEAQLAVLKGLRPGLGFTYQNPRIF